MTSAPKKPPRLTPVERLVSTSMSRLMKHRFITARHGKVNHGLKVEDTVILGHVRLAPTQGKVITATSLADDLFIDRKAAERGLKRITKRRLIVAKDKEGKEVYYENPEGYSYPPRLIDDVIELVADQIALGDRLKTLVAELDDQKLKGRIAKTIDAVKLTAF